MKKSLLVLVLPMLLAGCGATEVVDSGSSNSTSNVDSVVTTPSNPSISEAQEHTHVVLLNNIDKEGGYNYEHHKDELAAMFQSENNVVSSVLHNGIVQTYKNPNINMDFAKLQLGSGKNTADLTLTFNYDVSAFTFKAQNYFSAYPDWEVDNETRYNHEYGAVKVNDFNAIEMTQHDVDEKVESTITETTITFEENVRSINISNIPLNETAGRILFSEMSFTYLA